MVFELEEIIMVMTVILLGGGCSPRVSGSTLEASQTGRITPSFFEQLGFL